MTGTVTSFHAPKPLAHRKLDSGGLKGQARQPEYYRVRPGYHSMLISLFVVIASGLILGAGAKLADESGLPGIGMIGTYFGIWIVCITVIAIWSASWRHAIVCSVSFLVAMTAAYYITQMFLFGFFSPNLFLGWIAIALLLAPPFAALTYHARGDSWLAALGAALPVGLLLQEAYSLRYRLTSHLDYQLLFMLDLACATSLLLILAREPMQRIRVFFLALAVLIIAEIGFNYALPLILGSLPFEMLLTPVS